MKAVTQPRRSSTLRYRGEDRPGSTFDYLKQLADEARLGELFIATDEPYSKGSVVTLYFDNDRQTVKARGVVTYSRRWWGTRGMQVSLFEMEGPPAAVERRINRFRQARSADVAPSQDAASPHLLPV